MDVKALLKPAPDKIDLALTIIRVIVGIVFFAHGWQKVFMFGFEGVGGFFTSLGIPAASFFAIVVSLLELLGGLALILGFATRIVGALLAINMVVALFVVHLSAGFFVSEGGYEFVLLLGAAALAFALMGAKSHSIDSMLS